MNVNTGWKFVSCYDVLFTFQNTVEQQQNYRIIFQNCFEAHFAVGSVLKQGIFEKRRPTLSVSPWDIFVGTPPSWILARIDITTLWSAR